jgi:carbonic anhydrase
MQKLVEGIHRFQTDVFCQKEKFFQRLADGQQPLALFITCSDSRIDPNLLTQTQPGELFIMRNAGNIVPPYSSNSSGSSGEAASIEFAVSLLGVRDIIICGHSHCGAMSALLRPELADGLPAVRSWLEYAEATRRIIDENYKHISEPCARLTAAIEENVLVQLENLRTHPVVLAALARKQVTLHGWVYKIETGQVFAYNAESGQFESLDHPNAPIRPLAASQHAI